MSWAVVEKTVKAPRKKPVAKRVPVARPVNMTPLQNEIFAHLVKQYPKTQTCEEIWEALCKQKVECLLEDVWAAMDEKKMVEVCVFSYSRYVIRTE